MVDGCASGVVDGDGVAIAIDGGTSGHTCGCASSGRQSVDDTDVGQLAEVGGTRRLGELPRVQGVRPLVVTSLIGDGGREVVRVDERVVVAAHGQTVGVLILQARERDGVKTSVVRLGGVVGELTSGGGVAVCKEELHDRVRQTEVVALVTKGGVHRGGGNHLGLLDRHVTRGITHLHALVVVDHNVLGVCLGVEHARGIRGGTHNADVGERCRVGTNTGVNNQEVLCTAEAVVDADVVERKSSDGQSNTRVVSEPERQRGGEETACTEGHTRGHSGGQACDVTDHVTVTHALGATELELVEEIEPEVVDLMHHQLVVGDGHLLEDVVHEVASPADRCVGVQGTEQLDLGELKVEPHAQNVITRAVKQGAHVALAKVEGTLLAQHDGHVREPVGLLDGSNKVGDCLGAAMVEGLELSESCEIDESYVSRDIA